MSNKTSYALLAACVALAGACVQDLTEVAACGDTGDTTAVVVDVSLQPSAPLEDAPAVVRLRVHGRDGPIDPDAVHLFEGELSSSHLGRLAKDELPQTLKDRRIDALTWATGERDVVLAPLRALTPKQSYTIASGAPRFKMTVTIAEADTLPLLEMVWPPGGASPDGRVGVWCSAIPLPIISKMLALAPADVQAELRRGIASTDHGRRCVHLSEIARLDDGPLLIPPLLTDDADQPLGRLEPTPLTLSMPAAPTELTVCDNGRVPFGPGCAIVLDDRIVVLGPVKPLLWSIVSADGAIDHVATTRQGVSFVLGPLSPSSKVALTIHAMDVAGSVQGSTFFATTAPAMAHVVINEVLANPVGPEPTQEWLELYNDGLAATSLQGYALLDIGGETILPDVLLQPGGYAVVVNEAYDHSGEYDPAPAAGAVMVYVPSLGQSGLKNSGEPLKLVNPQGDVVSRFPTKPKPAEGRSVMRNHPKATDDPDSFALSEEGGSTPGAANFPFN